MKYCVIDLETSIHNKIGKQKASPFCMDNFICYMGYKIEGMEKPVAMNGNFVGLVKELIDNNVSLLVGQNIKFDLLYLMRNKQFMHYYLNNNVKVYDTMLAEYLITAQESKYAGLDTLATKYGGTLKDNKIKEYWQAGVSTEKIPMEEIVPYLIDDVENTELVYIEQINTAVSEIIPKNEKFFALLESQMLALQATTFMEFNGMAFDKNEALSYTNRTLFPKMLSLEKKLTALMTDADPMLDNPSSIKQVSTYLFGGVVVYKEDEPQYYDDGSPVIYKTGKKKGEHKTKLVAKSRIAPSKLPPDVVKKIERSSLKRNKAGIAVDTDNLNDILSILIEEGRRDAGEDFILTLLEYRKLKKDTETYFIGYCDLVFKDQCLHPNLNHTATNTGRLSCSAPNLQNVTSAE